MYNLMFTGPLSSLAKIGSSWIKYILIYIVGMLYVYNYFDSTHWDQAEIAAMRKLQAECLNLFD